MTGSAGRAQFRSAREIDPDTPPSTGGISRQTKTATHSACRVAGRRMHHRHASHTITATGMTPIALGQSHWVVTVAGSMLVSLSWSVCVAAAKGRRGIDGGYLSPSSPSSPSMRWSWAISSGVNFSELMSWRSIGAAAPSNRSRTMARTRSSVTRSRDTLAR